MKRRRNLLFAAVLAVLVMCGPAWAVDSDGLVSYWQLDEGSGPIAYDSAGDNDGAIYGAQWTTGKVGDALEFDGDGDYVDIGRPESLTNMGSGTIALWFKPASTLHTGSYGTYGFFERNVTGTHAPGDTVLGMWPGSGYEAKVTFVIANDTGTQGGIIGSDDNYWPAGVWQHAVGTWDNVTGEIRMFINGVEQADKIDTFTGVTMGADRDVVIGSDSDKNCCWWDGAIDEVAVWNRALSAEEVQELYQEGSGPIAHWKFDEGEGTTAYDSASDNDGTIYGAQWTTGKVGDALEFDGDGDYVDIGRPESLTNMGSATVALWLKPNLTIDDTLDTYLSLFNKNVGGAGVAGDTLLAFCPASVCRGRLNLDIFNETGGQFVISSDSDFWPAGVWQHVAASWDNLTGEIRMFINGVEQADKIDTFSGVTMGADRDVVIGSNSEKENYWWDGIIDEVAVWNRALSAEEIEELYQSGLPIMIDVDIKPGSCPNPLNLASRGVLPVAILGSQDFDVSTIDVAPTRLAGVPPVRSSYEDVAAPVSGGQNECECTTEGPDGYTDLTLKFKTQQIVSSLGEPGDGETLVLTLTGVLTDGISIEGTDCIVIVGKVPRPLAAKRADINGDGVVNILDFSMIAEYWLETAVVVY